jgi:hypothetical protein
MVLAGGVGGAVAWKAKALGQNRELWREKAVGVKPSLLPLVSTTIL